MELRVKEICKEKGLLFKDLAEKIGISDVGLRKQVQGNPTLETLEKIANTLGVDITELFNPPSKGIYGHIEYKGTVYTIKSRSDLENLLKIVE